MGREERVKIIKALEEIRHSKIITYITSDRPNTPPFMIADDAIKPIYTQLENLGQIDQLDFFLYTRGGSMMSSHRIVKLLRAYCKKLSVLVPWKAHSGGTQICLGADSIVMTKLGELSPVDPSTANAFNPVDRQGRPLLISVEDVKSYLDLAESKGGIKSEAGKLEVFKALVTALNVQTHPLALGNVNRVYDEIRLMIEDLLSLHMDNNLDEKKIAKIKHCLTEIYTHEHIMTKDEVVKLGLNVESIDQKLENTMMQLYNEYEQDLSLQQPFEPEDILGQLPSVTHDMSFGFIETTQSGYVFSAQAIISRPQPSMPQIPQIPNLPMPIPLPTPATPIQVTVRFKGGKWNIIK